MMFRPRTHASLTPTHSATISGVIPPGDRDGQLGRISYSQIRVHGRFLSIIDRKGRAFVEVEKGDTAKLMDLQACLIVCKEYEKAAVVAEVIAGVR